MNVFTDSRHIEEEFIGTMDETDPNVGSALIGSASCGDAIKLYIRIENNIIVDGKMKIFGCASAIASAKLMLKKLLHKPIDEVLTIKDTEIASELKLAPIKFHCSVLAEATISAAIQNYINKNKL